MPAAVNAAPGALPAGARRCYERPGSAALATNIDASPAPRPRPWTTAIPAGLVLLVSPLLPALGQTHVKRHGAAVSSLLLNRNDMAIGALVLATAAWVGERDVPSPAR